MKLKIRFQELLCRFAKQNSSNIQITPSHKKTDKKYIIGILALWVLVMLFGVLRCKAQEKPALNTGDKVPDVVLTNIINGGSQSRKLSDFKGKLVLLDFWATWCAPCVRMIPRIDSLQQKFNGQLQIISVTREPRATVEAFLARNKRSNLSGDPLLVAGDRSITNLFGNAALPHFAWISPDGRFIRTTSEEAVNETVIASVLKTGKLSSDYDVDEEMTLDPSAPLFNINNPTPDQSFTFRAVLTAYKPALASGIYSDVTKPDDTVGTRRITARNQSIAQLYQLAMSDGFRLFGWDRTLLLARDTTALNSSLHGHDYVEWERNGHAYCYELVVPKKYAGNAMARMRNDLASFFPQYKASVQKRLWKCFSLETINGQVNAPASGAEPASASFDASGGSMKNCYLYVFTRQLAHYLQKYRLPIVNNTGYHQKVDLDIRADLTDVPAINGALARYNLHLVTEELEQDVLVIEDN